ncbi:MAG: sensor histidine kinase, partial [Alphaproteobacteria bacterium]
VSDNGPGLSKGAMARLLSEAPVEAGGGVGLRLVRDFVASLGGRIACRRDGGLTHIEVVLPMEDKTSC